MKQFILKSSNQRISLYDKPVCRLMDGMIYSYIEDTHQYVKLYNESNIDLKQSKKLATMIEKRPPFVRSSDGEVMQLMWPVDLVFDDQGLYRGYLFDAFDLKQYEPMSALLGPIDSRKRVPRYSYKQRVLAAYHFAALLSNFHQYAIYLIDFNPNHIYFHQRSLKPLIIRCDLLSIAADGRIRYGAPHCSWMYCNPDDLASDNESERLGLEQDLFGMAVLIYQLLNQGIHPYQSMPINLFRIPKSLFKAMLNNEFVYSENNATSRTRPLAWSIFDYFDDQTKQMFIRAFSKNDPRPTAMDWQLHLKKYASEQSDALQECPNHPAHFHFFNGCGLCASLNNKAPLRDKVYKSINKLGQLKSNVAEKQIKVY